MKRFWGWLISVLLFFGRREKVTDDYEPILLPEDPAKPKPPRLKERYALGELFQGPEKVVPADGNIPGLPDGHGSFDPALHPDLQAVQKRATFALFERLGILWVPTEYSNFLRQFPLPTNALYKFNSLFGIQNNLIQEEDPGEIARLQQVVEILMELNEVKAELPPRNVNQIYDSLASRDLDLAEDQIDSCRIALQVIREIEVARGDFDFPAYALFADEVVRHKRDPIVMGKDLARDALGTHHIFCEAQFEFNNVLALCVARIEWIDENWPDNDYGNDPANTNLVNGMFHEVETLVAQIKESDLGFDDLADCFGYLYVFANDFDEFIREIRANHDGSDYTDPPVAIDNSQEEREQALEQLGFAKDYDPTEREVKKSYRKQALLHHPDRYDSEPDHIKDQHAEKFRKAKTAYEILQRPQS